MSDTEEMENFKFDEWASKMKLTHKTTQALVKEDCNQLEALQILTRADINRLELSVGQARLLRLALKSLGNPIQIMDEEMEYGHSKPNDKDEKGDKHGQSILDEASRELDLLLSNPKDRVNVESTSQVCEHAASYDPRMLLTIKVERKAEKIVDYLTQEAKERVKQRKK